MAENRSPIPAELKRRVLVEAGHRCAIPTCRYIETDIHHIVPWAKSQTHEYTNLIALCSNCHRRADKGEIDRKSLLLYKANLRFAHDKFSQLEVDILVEASRLPAGQSLVWNAHSLLLLKRILEAGYITVVRSDARVVIGPIDSTPLLVSLTDAGKAFLTAIATQDLENA